VQKPHPPILVGGDSKRSRAAARDYGDGWAPVHQNELVNALEDLPTTVFFWNPKDATPDALAAYADAGVMRCVFNAWDGSERHLQPLASLAATSLGPTQR
jgi:hypothetical protein